MSRFHHMNFIVNYNKADYRDLLFSAQDRDILQTLAKEVAEIAARPDMDTKRTLWTAHNSLETTDPVLLCDPENGWGEIITDDKVLCRNSVARHWEVYLRKLIFWGNEMGDDFVVEPIFDVPFVFQESLWSIEGSEHHQTIKEHDAETGGSYHIDTILDNYEDQFDKIIEPVIRIDYKASSMTLEIAEELFSGILSVRQKTWWFWSFGLTDEFAFLRGMDKFFMDMIDSPDNVHRLMSLISRFWDRRFDWLEAENLLTLNNDNTYVGSGGIGYTRELPKAGADGNVTTSHMWGLAESQITVGVSPDMFGELIFPYQKRLMDRFGLTCYGCCEPMDDRIDIVKQAKNLRRVSVSPWANKEFMADKLGKDYIFSSKPQPSYLATAEMDRSNAVGEIRDILSIAKNNVLEIIMKDNHTLGKNPKNLTDWVKIVRKEMEK